MKAKRTVNLLIIILFCITGSHQAIQAQLSVLYSEEEIKQQIENAKKGAEAGDLESQHTLAFMYWLEDYGIQDLEKYREWMKRAADNGYASSQCEMSDLYFKEEDYKAAFKYAKMAAEQDKDLHGSHLARFYEDGLGVPKDLEKAIYWYKRAEDADGLINLDIKKYPVGDLRWTFFAESNSGSRYYYMPQSVERVGSRLKVLVKEIPDGLKSRPIVPGHNTTVTYDQEITGYIINCSGNSYIQEERRSYYKSEEVNDDSSGWPYDIEPGTIMNALKKEICY